MEYNVLTIINPSTSELKIIMLTQEEKNAAYEYDDFEEFLYTLEEKYGFNVSDVNWMVSETLYASTYSHGHNFSKCALK